MYEIKDENGKTYQIQCEGVLIEAGILLENGNTLTEGKIVELVRNLSRLWNDKDYYGFYEAMPNPNELNDYEKHLLTGTVISENGDTVRHAFYYISDIIMEAEYNQRKRLNKNKKKR